MHIYSRYMRNLVSNRKCKKGQLADSSQNVACDRNKFCNTAYQEIEEMSQQHQYDELSCRDIKFAAFEQKEEKYGYYQRCYFFIQIHFLVIIKLIYCYTYIYIEWLGAKTLFNCEIKLVLNEGEYY